jgi:hypothetical protein
VATLAVTPPTAFLANAGTTTWLQAEVRDASGGLMTGVPVAWTTANAAVATVDASGIVTAVGTGTASIRAEASGVEASASVEVWVPPLVEAYEPGVVYSGRRGYVEYVPGELPLVISAPHGGALEPSEIPDRTWGTTVTDANTVETILAVRDAFVASTGKAPHIIISHLRRTKLDPNRDVEEAAQGSPQAENAWDEFHGFIEVATEEVERRYGAGVYLDLHGHGHAILRVELGYLLSAGDLARTDAELDGPVFAQASSLRALATAVEMPFSRLLRGPTSLGGFLGDEGVPSVPSPGDPDPGTAPYFSGGYATARHGSRDGGTVIGAQMELHRVGIRDTHENRLAFGDALAAAVEAFMMEHYGFFGPGG